MPEFGSLACFDVFVLVILVYLKLFFSFSEVFVERRGFFCGGGYLDGFWEIVGCLIERRMVMSFALFEFGFEESFFGWGDMEACSSVRRVSNLEVFSI